ncbi:MAG: ECF transporter S component [Lachnospiraceae bacterium]
MNHDSAKKLVTAGLFAALACAATLSVRIPTPGTGGYIHPGDGIVILCGLFFSPGWAMLTAGIGSALADLLGGYFIYVPITFLIKGFIALFTSLLFASLSRKSDSFWPAVIGGGIIDIIMVAGGYFLCESVLYGVSGAAASLLPNLVQSTSGLILACVLYPVLKKPFSTICGSHLR